MKKKYNISIVVPYFNEQKNITRTLEGIRRQTYQNFEVVLINSSSTDNSFDIVNKWIFKNGLKKKFKNYYKKTSLPSTSKNIGIKCSKYDWIAFMDCDLRISKSWLQVQVDYLDKHKTFFVMGLCHFRGYDLMDKVYVAQTWGFNSKIPVIPSSIFHRSIFRLVGKFQKARAGYDKVWKKKLANKNNNLNINDKCIISYNKYNHSKGYIKFLLKIFRYAYSSYSVKENSHPKIYFLAFLFFSLTFFISTTYGLVLLLSYLILRSFIFPLKKSKKIDFRKFNIIYLLILPIVGISIDFTRFVAYVLSFTKN